MPQSNKRTPDVPQASSRASLEIEKILRGLKAMYVDADAVTGEEEIYNFEEALQAITTLHDAEIEATIPTEVPVVDIDDLGKLTEEEFATDAYNEGWNDAITEIRQRWNERRG